MSSSPIDGERKVCICCEEINMRLPLLFPIVLIFVPLPVDAIDYLLGEQDYKHGDVILSDGAWFAAQDGEGLPFDTLWYDPTTVAWEHLNVTSSGRAILSFALWDLDNASPGQQVTQLLFDGVAQDIEVFEEPVDNYAVAIYDICVDEFLLSDASLLIDLTLGNTPGNAVGIDFSLLSVTLDPQCEGDANGDGTVDPLDLGYVLGRLGCEPSACNPECQNADVNGDSFVDPLDAGFVLARFGVCE